jgi:hypothetical protein
MSPKKGQSSIRVKLSLPGAKKGVEQTVATFFTSTVAYDDTTGCGGGLENNHFISC